MPWLRKSRSRQRRQPKTSKGKNSKRNTNNTIAKEKPPASTTREENYIEYASLENDLYSSSGSTEQVTLFSDNTEDSSSTSSIDADTTRTKSKDPYADVRDRMEALSLHSRMVHAYHSEDSASLEYNGEPTKRTPSFIPL